MLGWAETSDWWGKIKSDYTLPDFSGLGLFGIDHQGGGHSCRRWWGVALPVAINGLARPFVDGLCCDYFHYHGGYMSGLNYDDREEYRARLAVVGLTAPTLPTMRDFFESVYPIDPIEPNLRYLLAKPLEAMRSLRSMLAIPPLKDRLRLFLIAENSD